jgi:hypothetical protein
MLEGEREGLLSTRGEAIAMMVVSFSSGELPKTPQSIWFDSKRLG